MGGKTFTLNDGTQGTEAEAIADAIRVREMQKLQLDKEIAQLRRQLAAVEKQ